MLRRRLRTRATHFRRRLSSADSRVLSESAVRRCAAARPEILSSAHPTSPSIAYIRLLQQGERPGESVEKGEKRGVFSFFDHNQKCSVFSFEFFATPEQSCPA